LELAGFSISPAERLRVLNVLDSTNFDTLKSPEKLKYLLCPVLVQGRAEQERFYEIFDHYWEELQQPWELPVADSAPVSRVPSWVRWVLVGLVLGALTFAAVKLLLKENPPAPKVFFKHEPAVAIGDTVKFENLSENIDSSDLLWEVIDTLTGQTELVDSQSFDLYFVATKAGENPHREVRLSCLNSIDPKTSKPTVHISSIQILCNNRPVIDSILAQRQIKTEETARFEAKLANAEGVELTWDFGDSTTATGTRVAHKFANSGEFTVHLTATRTGLDGLCSVTATHRISVGQELAYFNDKLLMRDHVDTTVKFSWGTWVLMGLIGLAIIWFWVKWAARKPPAADEDGPGDLSAAAVRYQATDKGPYFIPFRPQEGFVRMEPQFYRLADVLRKRQEGLRRNMDVPASVKKTIAEGGFPNLLTRADAVPTEYLFLIDEQSPVSHQSKLYSFLVDFLRKREVLGEAFYFKTEPIRFWNSQFPEGLNPEQLYRFFPHHRLIVMGDGHGLLDPHQPRNAKLPTLRADANAFFRYWKYRMLLTPLPVVSWTFREAVLHNQFAIFPSDTDGLGEAVKFVERGMESEELPTYTLWRERLLEGRRETDVNYRRWRTASDHADFLSLHPELYRWVCALAVYPKPDWNITLAIGRALSPIGVELNYDNLLIISRIPWLVTGELSPRLRKELLADLGAQWDGAEVERLAREAVQAELQAVEALVAGSHANQEHQINLAMQNFAVAPDNPDSQVAIRELLALNLLTPRQLNDLNLSVEKHVIPRPHANVEMKMNKMSQQSFEMTVPFFEERKAPDIKDFLEENKPKPEPPEKPFITKDFWRASVATCAYLLIFLFVWNINSEQLTKWAKPDTYQKTGCEEKYLYAYFLKETCSADSFILYNNAGVDAYHDFSASTKDNRPNADLLKASQLQAAERNFKRALALKSDYRVAKGNLAAMYFNSGKYLYDFMLDSMNLAANGPKTLGYYLELALPQFRLAASYDSTGFDARHAIGLVHFYAGRQDSALIYYEALMQQSDSLYFTTLETYPNLQSLLARNQPNIQEKVMVTIVDAQSGRPLQGVSLISKSKRLRTDRSGNANFDIAMGESQVFDITRRGYQALVQEIKPTPDNLNFQIRMRPNVPEKPVDTDKDGVPDIRDKCPNEPGDPKNAGCPLPSKEREIPAQSTPPEDDPIQSTPEGKGNPAQQTLPKEDENEVVPLAKAYRKPVFKGCENQSAEREERCTEQEMRNFFRAQIKYPNEALKLSLEATIDVSFIVEKDGSITEVKALNYTAGGFVEEAIRLVGQLPKLSPGQNERGAPIRVLYAQSVIFSLK
jgi:PKD repeat protein